MFERYDEAARQALFFARYESSVFGSPSIEPEHLLLGVLRKGVPVDTLSPDIAQQVRAQVVPRITQRPPVPTNVEIPFSPAARRALEKASLEADALDQHRIGTEHILLALMTTEEAGLDALLSSHGLRVADMRNAVRAHSNAKPFATAAPTSLAQSNRSDVMEQLEGAIALVRTIGGDTSLNAASRELAARIARELRELRDSLSDG